MAGKDEAVYTGHYISRCSSLTDRDRQDFIASLKVMDIEEGDKYEEEEVSEHDTDGQA